MTTTQAHKIEEIVTTRNTVVIGCVCGWVHSEVKGFDGAKAAAKCRKAMAEHKAQS